MTSASEVRAYAHKHDISMSEARKRLRRKRLDALLSPTAAPTALRAALIMIVEDHYPDDLDRRFPEGRRGRGLEGSL